MITGSTLTVGSLKRQRNPKKFPFQRWVLSDGSHWADFYRNGDDYLLCFANLVDFEISKNGLDIRYYPACGIRYETIEHLYWNQVVPLALSLQNKLIFHASAVEIADGSVAFVGVSGRGKSSLAASFAASGFRFLTDDGLLLDKRLGGGYVVQPNHPSIRLWKDSYEALMHSTATLAAPVQFTSKSRILSDDKLVFCDDARPLRRLYFLGDGNTPALSIEPMRPSEALIELVKHSFLLDIEARDVIARHFDELTQMVSRPICYRLDYPRCYKQLPRVREAILQHVMEDESKIS